MSSGGLTRTTRPREGPCCKSITAATGTIRSPRRPNLVALTLCKIVAVKENVVELEKIDAFDGTPVLDMKPFLPGYDTVDDARVPDWVGRVRR